MRPVADGTAGLGPYRGDMPGRPRAVIVLSAIAIGVFQLVGSFGASHNDHSGRGGMDAVAVVLVLLGPLALAVRDRWPLVALAVSLGAAATYVGLGYVYGPIFV